MRTGREAGRRAVSLISFLVAVTILSFVLIPFYLAFQTSRSGTVRSLNSLVAANVASSVLERYRSRPFYILEAQLLGLAPERLQESTRVLNGPFETSPPTPDVVEREVHRSGLTVFDAEVYLSYFPEENPNPDEPTFDELRQRIRLKVVVRWRDRMGGNTYQERTFTLSTLVHNEKFHSKPSLRRLTESGGTQ